MAIIDSHYEIETDQYGLAIITRTGRCTAASLADIEGDCTRRFQMIPLPNTAGAIMKVLDGTSGKEVEITPATFGTKRYTCVKIDGRCQPMTPAQTAGDYSGSAIFRYMMKYQQVGKP